MATAESPARKVIGNVGVLDLRTATEESLAQIQRVGNTGAVLCSPATAHLVGRLSLGNVGSVVEVDADARIMMGEVDLVAGFFEHLDAALDLVAVGQITVYPDVSPEQLEQGLGRVVVIGQVNCPDALTGILQSKARDLTGQIRSYPGIPGARFHKADLALDEAYLQSLQDGSSLVVLGNIDAPQILDEGMLRRKVSCLFAGGKLRCREENLAALRSLLHERSPAPRTSVVPAGFEPVHERLQLDATTLAALPGRKLYCTGLVLIDPDLEPAALDAAVDALQATRLLVAPAHLREVVARKCNMVQTKAIFYEGELWHVEDESELRASRFQYLQGKATLVVRGDLTIAPDVEPQVLAERLHKVHNLGQIICTPDQMAALQARLGLSEGEFTDSTRAGAAPPAEDEEYIGNVGHLRL